jgi:DNA-binding GntR family transcriptional regulator
MILLDYPPGARLSEEELAREFDVSRTPIRRVLSRLEYEGFVEIRHGAGTFVTNLGWDDLVDAYQLRMRLAELIGELNPRDFPPQSIDRAKSIRDQVKARGNDLTPAEHLKWNRKFIFEAKMCIGNVQLREAIDRLYFLTQRHWFEWYDRMDWPREVEGLHWYMDMTIDCMERNDARGVGLIWRNIIANMVDNLAEYRRCASTSTSS